MKEHTCQMPLFNGLIPGCPRCEELVQIHGIEPYTWQLQRQAQEDKVRREVIAAASEVAE